MLNGGSRSTIYISPFCLKGPHRGFLFLLSPRAVLLEQRPWIFGFDRSGFLVRKLIPSETRGIYIYTMVVCIRTIMGLYGEIFATQSSSMYLLAFDHDERISFSLA